MYRLSTIFLSTSNNYIENDEGFQKTALLSPISLGNFFQTNFGGTTPRGWERLQLQNLKLDGTIPCDTFLERSCQEKLIVVNFSSLQQMVLNLQGVQVETCSRVDPRKPREFKKNNI